MKKLSYFFILFFNFSFAESFPVITENKELLVDIKNHFKDETISNFALKNFLLKNDYYSSEVIQQKENLIIKNPYKIVLVFKGNKFFTEKQLKKLINLNESKMGSFFYTFIEKSIKKGYQDQGFLKIEIENSIIKKDWKKWITIDILENSRVKLGTLKIKGLLSRPSSYYENFIINNSTDLTKSGIYNKKDLEKGYENLINHLKGEGFLKSKIYADRTFFKNNTAFINIQLDEGPLIFIRDIQIKNTNFIPTWEILSHIQSKIQSTFKIDKIQKDIKSIEDFYKNRGYIQAKVINKDNVIKYNTKNESVDIVIKIDEGHRFFISKIVFVGLKKVKKDLINSLLTFKIGDTLTPDKKEKTLQALSGTGLFSNISLNSHINKKDLEIIIVFKERKTKTLRGGLGLNSQRRITTQTWMELTHRNLFGWGRALVARGSSQLNLTQGKPFIEYEFSSRYKEVFIPKYAYQGNINISHSKNLFRYSENNINFVKKTQLSFFIDKNITDNINLKWNALSFESRKEFCTVKKCPENPQQITSSNIKMSWDKRNNIFDPSKGYLLSGMTEWSYPILGGNKKTAFIKLDIHSYLYNSFFKDYILGLILKTDRMAAVQNSEHIPVSRAFILGGQTSLRGYDGNIEGERIPKKQYAPIETANEALKLKKDSLIENVINSKYALIKVNFRFPILEDFKGHVFYDLGFVSLTGNKENIWDYGHSIGIGFRYHTFLIPVGLDIAYQLPPKSCEKLEDKNCSDSRFHLSIGW